MRPPLTVPPAVGEATPVTVHCWRVKLAVTVLALVIVTEQVPEPVQSPDQLVKR